MLKKLFVAIILCVCCAPAFAEIKAHTMTEDCEREKRAWAQYAENTMLGVELGCKLRGIKLSAEQRERVSALINEYTPKIAARLYKLGVYEVWIDQLLDPQMIEFNRQAAKCENIEQLKEMVETHTKYCWKKYPQLISIAEKDEELKKLGVGLLMKINAIIQ